MLPNSHAKVKLSVLRLGHYRLARLSASTSALWLWLDKAALQNHDCSILSQIPNLHLLVVVDNKLTVKDEERLRSFFPNAEVEIGATQDTGERFIRIEREPQRDEYVERALPHW